MIVSYRDMICISFVLSGTAADEQNFKQHQIYSMHCAAEASGSKQHDGSFDVSVFKQTFTTDLR